MQTMRLLIWTNQLVKDNCRKVINYASCDKDMMDIFLYVYIKSHIYNDLFQKTKIMVSGPITSWEIDGETVETVSDFILGSKITADGDCSYEIKICLFLGRKAMTNLDHILKKQRHCFADKGPSSQNYGFASSHVWI